MTFIGRGLFAGCWSWTRRRRHGRHPKPHSDSVRPPQGGTGGSPIKQKPRTLEQMGIPTAQFSHINPPLAENIVTAVRPTLALDELNDVTIADGHMVISNVITGY